jgi:hypothetical protein
MSAHIDKRTHLIDPATGQPWTPAFDGQRPPFQPGNQLAVTHGAFSAARTDPIARRFIDEIATDPNTAYLAAPRFQSQLWTWAVAAARVELLSAWVDGMDINAATNSARGQTSPLELLRKWIATAQTLSARLGLDPLSAARLGKDVAQGRQADAAGELTRLRAQHEAAQSPADGQPDGAAG